MIAVYHHDTRLGNLDALRGYPLLSVTSIRYLDAAQAMLLPGAGSSHIQGAIVISTTLPRDPGSVRRPRFGFLRPRPATGDVSVLLQGGA